MEIVLNCRFIMHYSITPVLHYSYKIDSLRLLKSDLIAPNLAIKHQPLIFTGMPATIQTT